MSWGGVLGWLLVAGALIAIEAGTVQLVCIWFACGAVLAALAAMAGIPFWAQLLICLVASVAVLIVGRPILIDRVKVRRLATNADRVVGQVGVVKQQIDNLNQTGRVNANGLEWTARSEHGNIIPAGEPVLVLRIDGVKLIVEPLPGEDKFAPNPAPEAGFGAQQQTEE